MTQMTVTRDGSDRFHTALSFELRLELEAGLLPADHPQLWSDADLLRRDEAAAREAERRV